MYTSSERSRAGVRPACLLLLGWAAGLVGGCGPELPDYLETGDLAALQERGYLRILMPPLEASALPRSGFPIDHERELAVQLAGELGLTARFVEVADRGEMLDGLEEGRGDLILARLTVTPERSERFDFSIPLSHVRELLVVRAADDTIARPADLAGRRVAVRASSSFHTTLLKLQEDVPEMEIVLVPERWDTEQILARVGAGEYDAAPADEDLVAAVRSYRDDVVPAFPLGRARPIAWAMRRGSRALKAAVDDLLRRTPDLAAVGGEPWFGDLEAIRGRKILRVLTRNTAASTYLRGGEQVGFEYELARELARSLGCRVQLVIPPDAEDLIPWLLGGKGDLIAASLTITPERAQRVAFTRPYLQVRQMIVARADEETPRTVADLAGRRVTVRPSSSYHATLVELADREGIPLLLEAADETLATEELIAQVGTGERDLTLADSHILAIELAWRDDVRGAFPVGAESAIGWAVRPEDRALLQAADTFLRGHGPGSRFHNVIYRRYFGDVARIPERRQQRPEVSGRISAYDELFRRYAEAHGMDWRLLAAQSYQESRFRPAARSHAGAVGLMQVRPRTARAVGVTGDLRDPDTGIRAGVLYLRRLSEHYFPDLPPGERLHFVLGAYNAGPGHIRDGRELARRMGYDEDAWFGQVDEVLPLLSRRQYSREARSGYCRCQETVAYVREINDRYRRYASAVD